jgi:hypothetical protein
MDFALGCSKCKDLEWRFQFFSVIKDNDKNRAGAHDIDPRSNFVHVSETEYSPKLIDLKSIDMAQLKISADQALQIAESNGGEEKRASVKNACSISLQLILDRTNRWQWKVYYHRHDDRTLFFNILIDPYTGEVVK